MAKKNSKAPVATEPPAPVEANDKAADVPTSPVKKRRESSSANSDPPLKPEELREHLGADKDLVITKEISKLNWKMNTSLNSLDDVKLLKTIPVSSPKLRKLQIFFPTGLHVTARAPLNAAGTATGVSVYDVLTAIHKMYRKKADDEIENPVLDNIEWGRGDDMQAIEDWPAVVLATQKKEQAPTGKKKNKQ